MSRAEMPRVYELCDLIADRSSPSSYFQDFDRSVASEAEKKRVWLAREREFQRLDDAAWGFLKNEALPYLCARDSKGRGWEQLISILNQARAYNYLVDRGCSDVRFVERAGLDAPLVTPYRLPRPKRTDGDARPLPRERVRSWGNTRRFAAPGAPAARRRKRSSIQTNEAPLNAARPQ
jgi:hypothetical protein